MCDCRSDWVMCFRRDCERAAVLNEAYQRQIELAHAVSLTSDTRK